MPVVSSYQDKAFGGLNGSEGSLEMCLQVRAKCAKSFRQIGQLFAC
jgi:hypothetical protein